VNFYFAASLFSGASASTSTTSFADAFAQSLSAALSFNYTPARLAVVSGSFGLPDINDTLWNTELQNAAATGVTVLAASGDGGNAPSSLSGRFQGQWPSWPASAAFDTYGVVSVGGVTLNISGTPTGVYNGSNFPTGFDSNLTGISSSTAWYDTNTGGNITGTEGGVSTVYSEPAWQFHSAAQPAIANASGLQGVTALGRSEPDVALAANTTIAYTDADSTGVYFTILEGTSVASPLFAGELASMSAVAGHLYGYLDPELYRIGSFYAALPSAASPYLDVTSGSNYVFAAGPGWDAVTGWGQVDAPNFLVADANASVNGYLYSGPTPGLPACCPSVATPPSAGLLDYEFLAGAILALIVALVIVFAGRSRAPPPASGVPGGAYGSPYQVTYGPPVPPPPGPYPPPPPGGGGYPPPPGVTVPASFACPYCGAPRPAEPVRCPYCGRM
jgi:subtilase family serine protease